MARTAEKHKAGEDLITASRDGDIPKLKDLLKLGASPNYKGKKGITPLIEAASRGSDRAVSVLLQFGADVKAMTTRRESALAYAAANGHHHIVKLLLDSDAPRECWIDIGAGKMSGITVASGRGFTKVVELLLDAGSNPDGYCEPERPIVAAARNKHVETVRLLLKHGASPNARGNLNRTALLAFAANGSLSGTELMLAAKADVDCSDDYGLTALTWACRNGFHQIAELLMNHEADPFARGAINKLSQKPGGSAMAWALRQEQRQIVEWLLRLRLPFSKFELSQAAHFLRK